MKYSPYQEAIFAFVAFSPDSAIVQAVAGSGKTTTIVEALNRAPQGTNSIFLAFNKAISEELKSRGVNARTFHSITYSPALRAIGAKTVNANKLRELTRASFPPDINRTYGNMAQKLVGLARNAGIGAIADDTEEAWQALADRHDIAPDEEGASMVTGITVARQLLQLCNASKEADFDDLLYQVVRLNIPLPRFDLVMVDESQDTNAIQRAILRKVLTPRGRVIAVGDSAQAIYGFRGADSSSMALIAKEFNCTPLPLTITYRCAAAIVAYASQWAPLEAAPDAPAGEVNDLQDRWSLVDFEPQDMVVCRTNAPLISLAYSLIRARVPCHIMGRDIGAGLTSLIEKLQPKGIDALAEKLGAWRDREAAKAALKGDDAKVAAILDKADCIMVLIDSLPENERTVPALCRTIDSLFSGTTGVTLASIHKSKGLEADTVWWLNRSACPSKWAKQAWQQEQERNLCYVAATRAKTTLNLIEAAK